MAQKAIGAVGIACQFMALRMMVSPRSALKDMATEEAYEKYGKDNKLMELLTRWCGLFFMGVATNAVWMSRQDATREEIRTVYRWLGLVWLIDSVFIKFIHFTPSGLIKSKDAAGAGVFDFLVGLVHLYISK